MRAQRMLQQWPNYCDDDLLLSAVDVFVGVVVVVMEVVAVVAVVAGVVVVIVFGVRGQLGSHV